MNPLYSSAAIDAEGIFRAGREMRMDPLLRVNVICLKGLLRSLACCEVMWLFKGSSWQVSVRAEGWYCSCWAVQERQPQTDWSEMTLLLRFRSPSATPGLDTLPYYCLLQLLLLPLVRMEIALKLLDLVTGSQDLDWAFRIWAALRSWLQGFEVIIYAPVAAAWDTAQTLFPHMSFWCPLWSVSWENILS